MKSERGIFIFPDSTGDDPPQVIGDGNEKIVYDFPYSDMSLVAKVYREYSVSSNEPINRRSRAQEEFTLLTQLREDSGLRRFLPAPHGLLELDGELVGLVVERKSGNSLDSVWPNKIAGLGVEVEILQEILLELPEIMRVDLDAISEANIFWDPSSSSLWLAEIAPYKGGYSFDWTEGVIRYLDYIREYYVG